ncbi:PREDICTED: uncharacterized protein LOC104592836 isoform X2 [Nelumbo nucifera]|uniref:Uncharacterized protein LOC104592836 isoform X2 n=1 Tax=Nelumbo nucifera TaxID=4432 RepID=A0A1U8Q135_NELNU|nr:PREDICTED: uncharacterized protein LOC104592836 isoform X2 [Nelumbo nucifera]
MGKLLCDTTAIAETFHVSSPIIPWREATSASFCAPDTVALTGNKSWETVSGLEDQQKRYLQRLHAKGVLWKHPQGHISPARSMIFQLSHGGDVEADGNCLFSASQKAMRISIDARELRRRTVRRFLDDLGSQGGLDRASTDAVIKHLYSPDLKAGWGIHVVQEVKLLANKEDRVALDVAINELVDLGLQREMAAESIYKERCIPVDDSLSWTKYMSISGSADDKYDIISLQYTEEGLLTVDENREGRAAAFGDDIAIESLATEFKREIYVVGVVLELITMSP